MLRPAIKNCLFAVTRPIQLETCRSKKFYCDFNKENFCWPKSWKENKLVYSMAEYGI